MLIQLDAVQQELIIGHVSAAALRAVVERCDPDDLVDMMQNVDADVRALLWNALPAKRQRRQRRC